MAADGFGNLGELDSGSDGTLENKFMQVMAAFLLGTRIFGKAAGREGVLPAPFASGFRVFPLQSFGQINFTKAIGEIFLVQDFHAGEVFLKLGFDRGRQNGDAVFVSFAIANDDLVEVEIDIFDAEAEAFEQTKAGAVEKFGQQLVGARQGGNDAVDFIAGHDQWDAF